VDVVVVGGGQAGLAVGRELLRRGRECVILDAGDVPGETWRRRWDSLRLFTPAGFSHLPGMPFPAPPQISPTKDAMADYLAAYAKRFALPVEPRTAVTAVRREGDALVVTAADGRTWSARDVVVATGAHRRPTVPAPELDVPVVTSVDYRRPDQLPDGPVLVIGAGNSGAEIAVDVAASGRPVTLAGRDVGHIPRLGGWTYPLMRALGRAGAELSRRGLRGGAEPLGRIRPGELEAAGIRRVPRGAGVPAGDVAAVVWCTGLRPDHGFLDLPVFDADGRVAHRRGVTAVPGFYVVGMPNQSSITSHLVGGVGADAAFVVRHLARRPYIRPCSGHTPRREVGP
jgi:putative flavoprotein involved in K+ transport